MSTILKYRIVQRGAFGRCYEERYVIQAYVSDKGELDTDTFEWKDVIVYDDLELIFTPLYFNDLEEAEEIIDYLIKGILHPHFDDVVKEYDI